MSGRLRGMALKPTFILQFLKQMVSMQFLKYKFRIFDSVPHTVLTIWHTQKFSALNNLNDEQIKIVPKTTELDRKLKQYFIIDLSDTVDCGRLLCPACTAGRFWVFLNFQNCSSLTFLSSSFSFFYSDPCPGLGAGASSLALSFYPEILHMSVCSPSPYPLKIRWPTRCCNL